MKKSTKLVTVLLALSIGSISHAQIGGMLKKAAKNAAGKEAGKATSGAASNVKLDWSMYPQTPAITMETLLSGTQLYSHGNIRTNFYTGTFVPNKTASGQSLEPLYKNEGIMRTKLFANDKVVKEIVYDGGEFFTEGKQMRYKTENLTMGDTDITQEGKYRLEFYAGDKMFYKFDFDVSKKVDSDPYASQSTIWYSTGPWDKYAYVTPQTTGNFIFGFYMMHTDFKPNPTNPRSTMKSVIWYPELYKDGKLISVKEKQVAQVERSEWKPFQTSIKLIGAKDFLKIADLADGNYNFKVTVDGEAAPRNYKFSMKAGKILQSAKQDRTLNTDPTTLVEGWNNFFWLERS